MAVREEEQRVRPRVREPNAHVRGERQRDREAQFSSSGKTYSTS